MIAKHTIDEIIDLFGPRFTIEGNAKNAFFTKLCSILSAERDSLVFISSDRKDAQKLLGETLARIVICDDRIKLESNITQDRVIIRTENPRLVFARIGKRLFTGSYTQGIHPSSVIHPDAIISPSASIGPFSYIGKCTIGNNVLIHGHVHLYDGVSVGDRSVIHAGTVIGADGFGYIQNENGEYENFPHLGGVLIEEDVEIGSNTCIDRGSLGDTIIRRGVKIDNLVHVAHNVVIGEHSLIIADALIGGSTRIGSHVWISPSAVLRDQISIGDHAMIGQGAIVTKDVPAGETWAGSPARKLEDFLALQASMKNALVASKKE